MSEPNLESFGVSNSEEAVQNLQDALGLNSEEKIKFVVNYVSSASYYEFDPASGESSTEEAKKQAKFAALHNLLTSIPNESINDSALNTLIELDLEQYSGSRPASLGEKIVAVLKTSTTERVLEYLPRLPILYQAGILADKDEQIASPYVNEWISKLRENPGGHGQENDPHFDWKWTLIKDGSIKQYDNYLATSISTCIRNWDPHSQERIILLVTQNGGRSLYQYLTYNAERGYSAHKDYKWIQDEAPPFIRLVRNWPPEISIQFLAELTQHPPSDSGGIKFLPEIVSMALSNWTTEDINQYLVDSALPNQLKEGGKDDLRLKLLGLRTVPLERPMSGWIKEGVIRMPAQTLSILKTKPEFISPIISDEFFRLSSTIDYDFLDDRDRLRTLLEEHIEKLTPTDKQAYIRSIAEILKYRSYKDDTTYNFRSDISQWDQHHLQQLALLLFDNLVPTKELRNYRSDNPQADNAEWVINQITDILDPELVKSIIRIDILEEGDHTVIATAKSKVADDPNMEAVINIVAIDQALKSLNEGDYFSLNRIVKKYSLGRLSEMETHLPVFLESMIDALGIETFDDLTTFIDTDEGNEYYKFLRSHPEKRAALTKEDFSQVPETKLSIVELEVVKRAGISPSLLATGEFKDWETLFRVLTDTAPGWQDSQSRVNPFQKGAEIFGYERMFAYMNRRVIDPETHQPTLPLAITRHDAMHAFERIIDLYNSSELNADQFWGNILNQVRIDDSIYDDGSSQHHLNTIAQTFDLDIVGTIEGAREFPDLPLMQEFVAQFNKPNKVFNSWPDLKRYVERAEEVKKREFNLKLQSLYKTNPRLAHYAEVLMYHKNS